MPVAVRELRKGLEDWKDGVSWAEEGRYFIQAIIREMEDGLLILNREGRIVEFNQSAQMISGYQKREVLGKFYRDVWGGSPRYHPRRGR